MGVPNSGGRRLRFGMFEADLSRRELYRLGLAVEIQEQPFQILTMLLERPGELLSREELCKRLWPANTFVDFDDGLNTAMRKLRYALRDSPENPTFIQTIPRRGYCFIAPVRVMGRTDDVAQPDKLQEPEAGISSLKTDNIPTGPGQTNQETRASTATLDPPLWIPENDLSRATSDAEGSRAPLPAVANASKNRAAMAWVLVSVIVTLMVAAGARLLPVREARRPMHFSVPLSISMRDLVLSHNGRKLVFVAPQVQGSGTAIWVHEIGISSARVLENTEGGSYPFWSPDDRFIAFFADGKLKKIEVGGGPIQVICDAPAGRGGTWNKAGLIVFAPNHGVGISQVQADGGPVTLVEGFENELATTKSYRWPVFLPDGQHFLYTSVDFTNLEAETNAVYVAGLHSKERHRLLSSNANAAYIPPGYLLFLQNGNLMAQRFDADRLQLAGETFAVADEVEYLSSVARALFSASEEGTLVYQSGSGATFSDLVWFDREGRRLGMVGKPARYANPRLSLDMNKVAVDIDDPKSSNTDIWLVDTHRRAPLRLTFDPSQDETPLWSRDGKRIVWLSDRGGKNGFYVKASDGSETGESPFLPPGAELSFASALADWSSDGRFLLYTDMEGEALHLWVLPMTGDRKPFRWLSGPAADVEGQFSPDVHWVAYSSNESGRWQVYVATFPGPGFRYQVSVDGGQQPRWRRDGKELFFLSRERKLMAAWVKIGTTFEFSAPTALFETHAHEPLTAEEFFTYDVSADGRQFLINVDAERKNVLPADIVLNWPSQAKN